MRVVSLVPSASESLIALGVTPVACTRFCDQPGLPAIGGTKNPDVDRIVELAPDLVVVNEEENRRADADALSALAEGVCRLATARARKARHVLDHAQQRLAELRDHLRGALGHALRRELRRGHEHGLGAR